MIAEVYDSEIKEDILSSENRTLDETVKQVKAKESVKFARKTVGASNPVASVKPLVKPVVRCGHCNRTGHTSQDRTWQNCPAFDKECSNCQKKGHFKVVCKAKDRSRSKSTSEIQVETSSIDQIFENDDKTDYLQVNSISFGELAAFRYCLGKVAKEVNNLHKLTDPHMLYDELKWITTDPPPAPYIRLQVRVDTKAFLDNNFKPPSAYRHRTTDLSVLADTGCQACCMGTEELRKLGLSEKDLLPVDMKLNGANGSKIQILGAIFIVISGRDDAGKIFKANQLCYVAEKVGKLLLSKEALIKLGMISKSFPKVGSYSNTQPVVAEVTDTLNNDQFDLEPCAPEEDGSCNCPRRVPVPEPPKFVPGLSTP